MRLEYFDMIDRVTAYDGEARTLTATSVVPDESPVFEGHFPGHPLVPGVLLTETMAQACGYLLLGINAFERMPFLMAIDGARFRAFVEPQAPLEIDAVFDMEGSGYAAAKAKIRSEGKAVADSKLRFRLMPFPGEMEEVIRTRTRASGLDDLVAGRRSRDVSVARRRVAVTGIGLVSSLGEGLEPHVAALKGEAGPVVDADLYAPYPVHPLPEVDWKPQIPKRGDQRQMETWQRLGVYTAGLALDSAGLNDDEAAKDRLEVLVAAGGGERDEQVDSEIATGLLDPANGDAYLNEHLMNDLRPTLFLAQLSNLLAGNIAIVHGVVGGSRTFMGEEQAGVDALKVASDRIAAGQCDGILVGGAYSSMRRDMMLLFEFAGLQHRGAFAPVFSEDRDGMIPGGVSAFLMLEPVDAALARGARMFAEVAAVSTGRARRDPGGVEAGLRDRLADLGQTAPGAAVVSAATGIAPWTAEERAAITGALPEAQILASGDLVGHGVEAAFPAAAALGALMVSEGLAPETVVTGAGHWRGEGAARFVAPLTGEAS